MAEAQLTVKEVVGDLRQYQFVTDTNAYSNGDVLTQPLLLENFFDVEDGVAWIDSLVVQEAADQTAFSFRVFFMDANVSLGTINAAINMSDANAAHILGVIPVATSAAVDAVNGQVYVVPVTPIKVRAVAGTRDLYCQMAVTTGTPTLAADSIKAWIGSR